MVVHVGVVVLAVGLTAASSFAQRTELALTPGQSARFDGHSFQFLGLRTVTSPASQATQALVRIDGGGVFHPAVTSFGGGTSDPVGTPAIDSGFTGDVYLTFDATGAASQGGASAAQLFPGLSADGVAIGVVVEPLIAWMWVGGLLIGLGGLLALWPGGRRRPTDPASAPSPMVEAATGPAGADGAEPRSSRSEAEAAATAAPPASPDLLPDGDGVPVGADTP
jgi:cytochrome c-type biogenesis protein CcmF